MCLCASISSVPILGFSHQSCRKTQDNSNTGLQPCFVFPRLLGMDLKTRHVFVAHCFFSSPSRRLRNRIRFRHKDEKSHRYGIHNLLSLRQQEGRVCPKSGLRIVRLDLSSPDPVAHPRDMLGVSALAHLGHRLTQLHELKAVLAQLSSLHAAIQLIHSHAGHLRSKCARTSDGSSPST